MGAVVTITGLDKVLRNLRSIGPAVVKGGPASPLSKALRGAAEPIKRSAIALAPNRSSTLKNNIIATRDKRPRKLGLTEAIHVTVRYGMFPPYNNGGKHALAYGQIVENRFEHLAFLAPAYDQHVGLVNKTVALGLEKELKGLRF